MICSIISALLGVFLILLGVFLIGFCLGAYWMENSNLQREDDIVKLYFRNSNNDLRFLGEPKSEHEAWKLISKFLKEHNCKYYYVRNWITPDGTLHYDVGSHTEFFELEGYGE